MKITLNKILAFFIAGSVLTSACKKDSEEVNVDSAKAHVTVKMTGMGFSEPQGNRTLHSTTNKNIGRLPKNQYIEASFNEKYDISGSLIPVGAISPLRASKISETVSNGPLIEPLPVGSEYTITVYEKGNASKEILTKSFKHGIDDSNISFDLEPGEYTFLASGNNGASINASENPAYSSLKFNSYRWKKDVQLFGGQQLNLDILLNYIFSEVTVTFNSGDIGNIESIGRGEITPHHNNFSVNNFSGTISYGYVNPRDVYFPRPQLSRSWTSYPVSIYTESTNDGEVNLFDITINGINGSVSLSNLTFEQGVKYNLQLDLGEKKEKTFKIGGAEFAMGNLQYDEYSDSYFFAQSNEHYGDYFFPNFLKPKKANDNPLPEPTINGNNGDPCKLIKPLNTWRLPTDEEIESLLVEINNDYNSNNGSQNTYLDHLKPYGILSNGLFFGTRDVSGGNRRNFLCLPFAGYYDNGANNYLDRSGWYLIKNKITGDANWYSLLEVVASYGDIGPGRGHIQRYVNFENANNLAVSIRCVKN
ncbi:hypothetical protein [Sphingobacterium sp. DR205]|uniref:hypothetical protein n=1 Tax=Sphingobacterium sp. DR205 TaxID=2713573 RepID=UPI0013E44A16|nr:hypothetical protein [Sphingobacterium sp. DR205]QIH31598.1 hypothetical protein G6053_01140 [Sphingobacterium sp. DR205]